MRNKAYLNPWNAIFSPECEPVGECLVTVDIAIVGRTGYNVSCELHERPTTVDSLDHYESRTN